MSDWNDGFKAGIEAAAKAANQYAEDYQRSARGDQIGYAALVAQGAYTAAQLIRALKHAEAKPQTLIDDLVPKSIGDLK